jgi:hypothetical protein
MARFGSTVLLAALGAMTIATVPGAALAQLVTPPPQQVGDQGDFIRRMAPPRPRLPQKLDLPPDDKVVNITPKGAQPGRPKRPPLPELDWPALARQLAPRDAEGKVIPIREPVHLAALRVNPQVKPDFVAQIADVLRERRASQERIMIANLDLVERVEDGAFEGVQADQKQDIKALMDLVAPLRHPSAPKSLTEVLEERGMIDMTQADVNRRLVKDYSLSLAPKIDRNHPDKALQGRLAFQALLILYKSEFDEFSLMYANAQEAAARHYAQIASGMELPPDAKAALLQAGARAAEAQDAAGRRAAWNSLRETLTLEQRREFYSRVMPMVPVPGLN